MRTVLTALAIFGAMMFIYPGQAGAADREESVARLLPRTVVGSSWSGCGTARSRALTAARKQCRSQGGLEWYEYDSCRASNAGLATIYMSYQCKAD